MTLNEPRIAEVFGKVFEAYARREGMFAERRAATDGPQNLYRPKRVAVGDADHIYWLALVAFSDRRTVSRVLYRNFAKMFDRNPTLFERGRYPTLRRTEQLFRRYEIALPDGEIAFFVQRKRHLDELFGGDPLKVYEVASDATTLVAKLRRIGRERSIRNVFPGAKEKIFCLLAMFLREYVDLDFADVVPVDVWVQSICAATGGLEGEGCVSTQTLERMVRPLVTRAFGDYRATDGAANATWILGRYGCNRCAGADMRNVCPVYDLCRGPFERTRHPKSKKHLGAIELPLRHRPRFAERAT